MKILLDSRSFLRAAGALSGFITSASYESILSSFLFEAKDDQVAITATNITSGLSMKLPCVTTEPGSATIHAGKLIDAVKNLPAGDLSIDVENGVASIRTTGRARFRIRSLSKDRYPEIPRVDGITISLDALAFSALVDKTKYAASDDETRYFMNGVFFEKPKDEDAIIAVATDGRRLARARIPLDCPAFPGVIIPDKNIAKIAKLATGSVKITFGLKVVTFEFADCFAFSAMVEGQFPNYRRVIPENQLFHFTFNRQDMISALGRVLVGVEKSRKIFLGLNQSTVSVEAEGEGVEVLDEIPINTNSPAVKIALNASYLMDAMRAIDDETVSIKLTDPARALSMEGNTWLHIVMPMQLD